MHIVTGLVKTISEFTTNNLKGRNSKNRPNQMKPNHDLLLNGKNHAPPRKSFYLFRFSYWYITVENDKILVTNRSCREQQKSSNNFCQSEMFQLDTIHQKLACKNQYHAHVVVYSEFLIRKCIASSFHNLYHPLFGYYHY